MKRFRELIGPCATWLADLPGDIKGRFGSPRFTTRTWGGREGVVTLVFLSMACSKKEHIGLNTGKETNRPPHPTNHDGENCRILSG